MAPTLYIRVAKSVAATRRCRVLYNNTTARSCPPRCCTLSTMATTSASDPLSIFRGGKLKPGIYKIQNLYRQTYMDIHEHSREVCCQSATALEEGRGLVRPFQQPVAHVPNDQKWEIKPLGAGYSVRRVSIYIYPIGLFESVTVRLMARLNPDRARKARAVLCSIARVARRGSPQRNPVSCGLEACNR